MEIKFEDIFLRGGRFGLLSLGLGGVCLQLSQFGVFRQGLKLVCLGIFSAVVAKNIGKPIALFVDAEVAFASHKGRGRN